MFSKQVPYTERDFRAEFCGLDPAQFVDLLAMVGDSSDNIPGVEGIGPKTAPKLLEAYGNIEGCIANASEARNKRVREVSALILAPRRHHATTFL